MTSRKVPIGTPVAALTRLGGVAPARPDPPPPPTRSCGEGLARRACTRPQARASPASRRSGGRGGTCGRGRGTATGSAREARRRPRAAPRPSAPPPADHPHAVAHAGQLDDLQRLERGDRRAVEHVARAGAPALGGEHVRLGAVGDVDDADVGVDERRQLAVEVVEDELAVAGLAPGPWTEDGLIATSSTPVRWAAAKPPARPHVWSGRRRTGRSRGGSESSLPTVPVVLAQ